ncbi:MAG: Gfo/Idh/MocA family protein [Armatimonadota bacterium]
MAKLSDALRVAVIGPGGMGRERCREIESRPDATIVAAADNNALVLDHLDAFLEQRVDGFRPGQIKRYVGEYEFYEMIEKEKPDIVGVFSPHSLHDVHIKAALRGGAHVLVEKPMTNWVGDAVMVVKMALGTGKHVVICYQRHYSPLYVTAKRVIADGLIGDLTRFEVYLAQRWGGGGWRGDPRFSGGGQPNDSGSHLQDMLLWITGLRPVKVEGTTDKRFEDDRGNLIPKFVEINSYSDITLENGAEGKLTIIGNTKVDFEEWVVLEGTKGRLEIREGKLLHTKNSTTTELPQELPEGYPKSNIDNLVGLIRGAYSVNYTSAVNGLRTSWLTNCVVLTGKGPADRNTVVCDDVLVREGTSRQEVVSLIQQCAAKGML